MMKIKKSFKVIGLIALIICVANAIQNCGSSSSEKEKSLDDMLEEYDFQAANKYLTKVYTPNDGYYIQTKYLPAAIKVLKAEATYLMDQNDQDAETLFMLCVNDVSGNIVGMYQPKTGFYEKEPEHDTDHYAETVTPYNECLLSIIREASIKNKPDFAKKVLKMMKPNYKCNKIHREGEGTGYTYNFNYEYSADNSQIEEAKKIISEME